MAVRSHGGRRIHALLLFRLLTAFDRPTGGIPRSQHWFLLTWRRLRLALGGACPPRAEPADGSDKKLMQQGRKDYGVYFILESLSKSGKSPHLREGEERKTQSELPKFCLTSLPVEFLVNGEI